MKTLAVALALALAAAGLTWAYTYQGTTNPGNDGRVHHPTLPVAWQINDQTSDSLANISAGSDPRQALRAGFAEWEAESGFATTEGALSAIDDFGNDGVNLMTFADTTTNRDLVGGAGCDDGPLAVTILHFDSSNEIGNADIVFNPCINWSTTGVDGTFPVSSVGTHEIGHFLGLDHSAVGAATMYPFGDEYGTTSGSAEAPASISGDDRAGANGLYGDAGFLAKTGSIDGLVTRSGLPLYGAHVVATRIADGLVFGSDITRGANLPGQNGRYRIDGLPPGSYRLHAEPADGPTTEANWRKSSPLTTFWYEDPFPTDWRTTFLGGNASPSSVSVTAGATSTPATLAVTDGDPSDNPTLIGRTIMGATTWKGIPLSLQPGTTSTVVVIDAGGGVSFDNNAAVACSDPAVTIGTVSEPFAVMPFPAEAIAFDVTVPSGTVPGPRSLIFVTDNLETSVLTGFIDVAGPTSETVCDDDFDDDGDGCIDCDDSDCSGELVCIDQCPGDPDKLDPGLCGCGVPDDDTDGDGVEDCHDPCPADNPDDSDGDGVCDSADVCPGFDDTLDGDGDGTPDCLDGCPADPGKVAPGACGCGVPDEDLNGDTVPDCCMAGDVWPDGVGDDAVDLRDWAQAVFKAVTETVAITDYDLTCGDVGPSQANCLPDSGPRRICPDRDGAFTALDADVIRSLAAGTDALDCSPCLLDRNSPGGDFRRVADVAPRADGGNGLADVADILLILNWAVGNLNPPLPGDEEYLRADVAPFETEGGLRVVQGGGGIDVTDVLAALRHVVGLDILVWPQHLTLVRVLESPTAFIGFQVVIDGWDDYAESFDWTAESMACASDGGLDSIDNRVVVTCLGTATSGTQTLFGLSYRAPESSSPDPISMTLIEADLDLPAGIGELLPAP